MTFSAKAWEQIAEELLGWVQGNPDVLEGLLPSDLAVGSLERAHIEAVAVALEEMYFRVAQALPDAISESCYRAFGFDRLPGSSAVGSVVFSSLSPVPEVVTIPAGTLVLTPSGLQFTTTEAAYIQVGSKDSSPASVVCGSLGSAGNVPAGSLSVLPYPIRLVDSVSNPAGTVGGRDLESEESRAVRFAAKIATLPRGTAAALEFAALSAPGVAAARCVEPYTLTTPPPGCPTAGLVWLWVDDGSGGVVSSGVAADVSRRLAGYRTASGWVPGWKAAGIPVVVRAAVHVPVKVHGVVRIAESARARFGSEILPALTQAARLYFGELGIGDSVSLNSLLVALAAVDEDILEIDLNVWQASGDRPASPSDLVLANPSVPDSTGLRPVLADGMFLEAGAQMAYPMWSLA